MRRQALPLVALLALPAALVGGCGGGAIGSSTTGATAAATQPATQPAKTSSTTKTSATRTAAAGTARRAPARASPHAFAAGQITSPAASALAHSGAIVLPVATGGPGRITAFGQAEIPNVGIIHVATARPATATRAGIVDLTLALTPLARRQLAAGRSIDMFVAVQFSRNDVMQREEVVLRP